MSSFPALAHVAVTVTDPERSTRWYNALFDAEPVLDEDEETGGFHHTVYLIGGGQLFGLHTHPGALGDKFNDSRPAWITSRSPVVTATSCRTGPHGWTRWASPTAASSMLTTDPASRSATPTGSRWSSSRRRPDPANAERPSRQPDRKVMKGGSHLCAPSYCHRYRPAATAAAAHAVCGICVCMSVGGLERPVLSADREVCVTSGRVPPLDEGSDEGASHDRRPVPHRAVHRARRHGRGLAVPRRAARARGRCQADRDVAGRDRSGPRARHAGGTVVRGPQPSSCRLHLRRGGGGRPHLAGDGVRRLPHACAGDQPGRAAVARGDSRHRGADRRGTRSDPRRRHHPPRRQTRQHPGHRRQRREDQRLRNRARSRPEPADGQRTGHRDTDVLRTQARARRKTDPGSRRLGARGKPVCRGRGPSAVRESVQRAGTAGDDRIHPADSAASRRHSRRADLADARSRSGFSLDHGARRPRGSTGCAEVIPTRPGTSPPPSGSVPATSLRSSRLRSRHRRG